MEFENLLKSLERAATSEYRGVNDEQIAKAEQKFGKDSLSNEYKELIKCSNGAVLFGGALSFLPLLKEGAPSDFVDSVHQITEHIGCENVKTDKAYLVIGEYPWGDPILLESNSTRIHHFELETQDINYRVFDTLQDFISCEIEDAENEWR